jgi:hypothetical protein
MENNISIIYRWLSASSRNHYVSKIILVICGLDTGFALLDQRITYETN